MTFRVLTAEVAHETNTFSRIQTDEQAFRDRYFLTGSDALKQRDHQNTEIAGFMDSGRKHGWAIEHILSAAAGPSGKVSTATFDWLVDPIITAATNQNYDGLLLGLHGAMVTEFCEDGEGELLRRLRAVVGHDTPIAITLDLHANVTEQMCALANIIVSYKTYPHIDMRDTGQHAGEILQRCMSKEIHPITFRIDTPMLEEVNGGRTDVGPMTEWLVAARDWETRSDAFAVSINGGFASSDIHEVGPTVVVTAEGDMEIHRRFAESIADDIWHQRHQVMNEYLDVDTAAARAKQFDSDAGPLIIADYADNPGAGSYGDSTNLLRALLDAGISNSCFGPMVDSDAIAQLENTDIGEKVNIRLGGKVDPTMGGGPLELQVTLLHESDGHYVGGGQMIGGLPCSFGATAVVRCDGIEILITSLAQQLLDQQQFKAFGIDPESKSVIALKSMQHFRAAFEPIAAEVIVCDSGALATPNYRRMNYKNVRRPIFPLDVELDTDNYDSGG
jgi:microcystin degradation protein MlrC